MNITRPANFDPKPPGYETLVEIKSGAWMTQMDVALGALSTKERLEEAMDAFLKAHELNKVIQIIHNWVGDTTGAYQIFIGAKTKADAALRIYGHITGAPYNYDYLMWPNFSQLALVLRLGAIVTPFDLDVTVKAFTAGFYNNTPAVENATVETVSFYMDGINKLVKFKHKDNVYGESTFAQPILSKQEMHAKAYGGQLPSFPESPSLAELGKALAYKKTFYDSMTSTGEAVAKGASITAPLQADEPVEEFMPKKLTAKEVFTANITKVRDFQTTLEESERILKAVQMGGVKLRSSYPALEAKVKTLTVLREELRDLHTAYGMIERLLVAKEKRSAKLAKKAQKAVA